MFKNKIRVVTDYDSLIQEQQKLFDAMSNLGRKKDYEVSKVEKFYQSKIEQLIREQNAVQLQLDLAKKYVNNMECSDNVPIKSAFKTKKED